MERDEDLEDGEMVDREMEDGGEGSNIYDEQSSAGGAAEISLDIPIRLIENSTQCDPPFLSIPQVFMSLWFHHCRRLDC